MARQIIQPRWANDQKTHIIAKFVYDDGRQVVASITNVPGADPNPDWAEIMQNFTVEQIDKITQEDLAGHVKRKQEAIDQRTIDAERQQKEALFNAKAEAFDMDVVKNSTNRDVKNKIRRASSIMEVHVYTAMLHMMEDPLVNPPAADTTANTA